MNLSGTQVQWLRNTGRGIVPGMSVDPLAEREEETTERLSVDLPATTVRFLERFAAYRNALNTTQSKTVKKWTRKSAAEAFVAAQVRAVTESMALAFEQHGELPDATDEKAMLAYARAILTASDKPNKKR